MATGMVSRKRTVALWIFKEFLGLLFLVIGISKLTGTLNTVAYFDAIGWGQWFRYLTGFFDVVGAVLIFVPRCTSYGALLLTCTTGTATLLALFKPDLPLAIPLVFALLAVTLAWLARPRPIV
jgi:putative oxidoreductase